MNTRTFLSSLIVAASFAVTATAPAADGTRLTQAEFGRDGVPRVNTMRDDHGAAVRLQPFGRGVPETRDIAARSRSAIQGHSTSDIARFGRA